ncbi:MAG: hypothetical protein HQL74_07310 [Magnetococcales bacterium]|nr:hypothetical protein [Magnetococcales bacterium]
MEQAAGGFDTKAFLTARFTDREADIELPGLEEWMPGGKTAVFTVRGLTGEEVARVREAVELNSSIDAVASKVSGFGQYAAGLLMNVFGMMDPVGGSVPDGHVYFIAVVRQGCVSPKLDQEMAVKFGREYPIQFGMVAKKILELTGLGRVAKEKRQAS